MEKERMSEYRLEDKCLGEENSILKGKWWQLNTTHEQKDREKKGIALRFSWLYDKLENNTEMLLLIVFLGFSFS